MWISSRIFITVGDFRIIRLLVSNQRCGVGNTTTTMTYAQENISRTAIETFQHMVRS